MEGGDMADKCNICNAPLDDGVHRDCGGDCLLCMVTVGNDPGCVDALREEVAALLGERDQLYKLLAALVWDQPKHVLHISRHAWNAMDNIGHYELVKADAPDGTVRLTAKHNPVKHR